MSLRRRKRYFLLLILAIIVTIPLWLYLILLNSRVQTYLTNKLSGYLKKEFGLTMSVGQIYFTPINSLKLDNVYVEDLNGDTLLYINQLNANIKWLSLASSEVVLERVKINRVKFHLRSDSLGNMNINKVLDLFDSGEPKTDTTPSKFRLYAGNITVRRADVMIQGYNPEPTKEMNFNDLHFKKTNIDLQYFLVSGNTIQAGIKNLNTVEKSGMKIENLSTDFIYDDKGLKFERLSLKTGNTELSTLYFRMLYLTDEPFVDFVNNVSLDAVIFKTIITTDDLAYIIPDIDTLNLRLSLEGGTKGAINNLSGTNIIIKTGYETSIHTNFTINNLLDFQNININATVNELKTSKRDLNSFTFLKNSRGESLLPAEIRDIDKIWFNGKFKGNPKNIDANGSLVTNLGTVTLNAKVSERPNKDLKINGSVNLNNFDVATILKQNENTEKTSELFNRISAKCDINCTLLANNSFQAKLQTFILSIDYNNYRYKNILINGFVTEEFFDGDISIKDPNIALDFTGKFEYGTKELKHRFILNIGKLNLYPLKFDTDPQSFIKLDLVADMQGLEPDEISGKITFYETYIKRKGEDVYFPNVNIGINKIASDRKINILSDFFNLQLSGNYSFNTISEVFNDVIKDYIPSYSWTDKPVPENDSTNINLKIKFNEIQPVVNLFDTTLKVSPNSSFDVNYSTISKMLMLKGQIDHIEYGTMSLDSITLDGYNQIKRIVTTISSKQFNYAAGQSLKKFLITSVIEDDKIILNSSWNNYHQSETGNYSGFINAELNFPTKQDSIFKIEILPSNIVIANYTWDLFPSVISISDSKVEIKNFMAVHRNQFLEVNGIISSNIDDTVSVKVKNVNIDILNVLLHNKIDLKLNGILTADISATQILENPFVISKISLDSLKINNQLIGNTLIQSSWDPFLETIHIELLSTVKDYEALYIVGNYDPTASTVNFRLFINQLNLDLLNPYISGLMTDLTGLLTAEIIIKGKTVEPKIEGVVILDRVNFILNYTQTKYQITDWIDISPNAIIFSNLRVMDINNNYTLLSGRISHQNFDNIMLDINFESKNFMFLNTLEKDNSDFFGTVFVSGEGNLKGTTEQLDIALKIKTEPNTRLFVPLNSSNTVSKIDYITFVQPITSDFSEKETVIKETVDDDMKLNLSMNLEITPEAEIQIIFDPTIGDIIKAKGSSNLNIYIYPNGTIEMYGDYIISEGDYLFTLQDIFQKRFSIAKGSSITWQGDPLSASMDVDAIYKVRRAALYDLTFNPDDEEIRVSADAHLLMSGTITDPKINFQVSLPVAAEQAQEQLNALPLDEISKQVISLLVLGRFQPLPGTVQQTEGAAGKAAASNASELLSNQVSNWLSQISKSFDIGFNYTPGGETTTQEYELAVSTQILNNRVTINGTAGMGGQQVNYESGSAVVGDVEMEIKLDKRGRLRFKGYTKTENSIEASTKQGAGVFYREEFNTVKELMQKIFKRSNQ